MPGYLDMIPADWPDKDRRRGARTLEIISGAAMTGLRCPTGDQLRVQVANGRDMVPALAHAGLLEIHIFRRNYRQVFVLAGPAAGKSTQAPPWEGCRPYKVVNQHSRANTNETRANSAALPQPKLRRFP